MPAVFVHGVPDTRFLWQGVLAGLSRPDTLTVSLPAFGVDAIDGFSCSKEEYVDWLIRELEEIGEPVDLVGHDWGALLTERIACLRPDLLRTWAAGGAALDESFEWHPVAKLWQTPGVGEQVMQATTRDVMAAAYIREGVPEELAQQFAGRLDERMKAAVLKLYRSAIDVGSEWSPALHGLERPGLVIWGRDDPFLGIGLAEKMAKRVGARLLALEETSHWWPAQRPRETAAALEEFWAERRERSPV